jgi:hypothetical protein
MTEIQRFSAMQLPFPTHIFHRVTRIMIMTRGALTMEMTGKLYVYQRIVIAIHVDAQRFPSRGGELHVFKGVSIVWHDSTRLLAKLTSKYINKTIQGNCPLHPTQHVSPALAPRSRSPSLRSKLPFEPFRRTLDGLEGLG